ncbi:MAG: metalloregulator ArsR/SmtB family transcription factor [Rubrobacteraceae bacterium]
MMIKGRTVKEDGASARIVAGDANGSCLPVGEIAALEDSEDQERLAKFCKALGHPVRVRIVKLLLSVDTCVCGDIVEKLPLAQSTVSQHLKVLKEAGLIEGAIDGPRTCYCLNREALSEFKGLSDALL